MEGLKNSLLSRLVVVVLLYHYSHDRMGTRFASLDVAARNISLWICTLIKVIGMLTSVPRGNIQRRRTRKKWELRMGGALQVYILFSLSAQIYS